ncbi:hypothetical protein CDL12_09807 [Handroanthus impetiginosus]|uniref:C2 domain-containing protein n=1 Tax=Handroanthus impetiginosus TaxID=429701 RepID=A0A2G9HJ29_9LAMI|nr:hypothetical protein CDL12_09807 [Handroanthus impetiginosus]
MDDKKNSEKYIGVLEICIHRARNIHNICIYQNQDVYAKFCLTDKPEEKLSSQVINGGGRNPVFNETLRFDVQKLDSSLRCEVWMLSRVKSYLEDQLLGFVSMPLSDVVSESGKPAREFELSSSELFHSPAGFVELSFKFTGTSSEVTGCHVTSHSSANVVNQDDDNLDNVPSELDRIEFPDQEIVNENERMVSEYMRTNVHSLERDDTDQEDNVVPNPVSSESVSESSGVEKSGDVLTGQHLIDVGAEPEQKMVQEEIVDMYMKGMQQFTDALAKMKLPMDGSSAEKGKSKEEDSSSSEKEQPSKSPDPSPRVFYGSGAFF